MVNEGERSNHRRLKAVWWIYWLCLYQFSQKLKELKSMPTFHL